MSDLFRSYSQRIPERDWGKKQSIEVQEMKNKCDLRQKSNFFFFYFLVLYLWHIEFPRLGV